jgi:hypothetical protein
MSYVLKDRGITKPENYKVIWTNEQVIQMLELLKSGMKAPEVAENLGRSLIAIRTKMTRAGAGLRGGCIEPIEDGFKPKLRDCIVCRQKFMSAWKTNYICKDCKDRPEFK